MTDNGILQLVLALGVMLACVRPLGWYMARVYSGRVPFLDRVLGPVERAIYRLARIDAANEMRGNGTPERCWRSARERAGGVRRPAAPSDVAV